MKFPYLALCLGVTLSARAHDAAAEMSSSAVNLLSSLDEAQRSKAQFKLDADERLNWHFIPKERNGLSLKEMTPAQRHLAYALLGSGLSSDGFTKATTIMSLEQILRELENAPDRRDPEKYFFSVFGDPKGKAWAWRCEGHHCSVNFTIANGKVSGTPCFFGSNPGAVREGPRQGLRVLGAEEEAGRTLVKHLSDDQKKVAVLPGEVPKDILSEAKRKADRLQPAGLPVGRMTPEQKPLLRKVVEVYLRRLRGEVAEAELAEIDKAGFDDVHFAWSGGTEPGQPHYYRVQGPTFLLEYDNTQNNANHPHAVWREFNGDFGADLLAEHHKQSH
ncbi:MAG: DUF3500 domain-containing protein [Verrucomicrobiales bacterium]